METDGAGREWEVGDVHTDLHPLKQTVPMRDEQCYQDTWSLLKIWEVYTILQTCKQQEPMVRNRGGEISKMYTCPRTTGCKKALVRTKALLAHTQINTKARFVNSDLLNAL